MMLTHPLGGYMTAVFNGERTLLSAVLRPLERGLYRISGVDETKEQHWVTYAIAVLLFSLAGFVTLYGLQRLQGVTAVQPTAHRSGSA
jgi:K+-transporting ATPase ATPase A chain